jgi:hypothetical protein
MLCNIPHATLSFPFYLLVGLKVNHFTGSSINTSSVALLEVVKQPLPEAYILRKLRESAKI